MHLISPLISGVQGAGNGSAAILRRGTSTLATLYSSFEGGSFASSSLDNNDRVILDSYGRAQVYVDEVVDVSVYGEDGTLQIEFTAGVTASAVEVRSQSFTGNAYDMTTANAAGQPTSLQAVLDLWLTIRSQTDWGLAASDAQPFFVVTDDAFGATGNGSADDTIAIQAAITAAEAAGGGILFFPAGTYRCTAALTLPTTGNNITFLGVGADSTALVINDAAESLLSLGDFSYLTIEGLQLNATTNNTSALISLDTSVGSAQLTLRACTVGSSNNKGILVSGADDCDIRAYDCNVVCGQGASQFISVTGTSGSITVSDCAIEFASGAHTTASGIIHGNNMWIRDTEFDIGQVSSGDVACVKFNTGVASLSGKVTGCNFIGPLSGSADVICIHLATPGSDTVFTEDNNRFDEGFTQYTTPSLKAYEYGGTTTRGLQLRSRDNRVIVIADNSANVDIPTDQYGSVVVVSTHTAAELDGDRPPEGSTGWVFFYHTGAGGTATLDQNFFGDTAATTANTSTHAWGYVCVKVNATQRMMVTVDAKACGNGA